MQQPSQTQFLLVVVRHTAVRCLRIAANFCGAVAHFGSARGDRRLKRNHWHGVFPVDYGVGCGAHLVQPYDIVSNR